MEAAWWRWEREQRRMAWQAWMTASLSRAKRLPSLKSLLEPKREFTPAELAERKADHKRLQDLVNRPEITEGLTHFMEQRGVGRKTRRSQRTDSSGPQRAR